MTAANVEAIRSAFLEVGVEFTFEKPRVIGVRLLVVKI
jgi:hypothetical protein